MCFLSLKKDGIVDQFIGQLPYVQVVAHELGAQPGRCDHHNTTTRYVYRSFGPLVLTTAQQKRLNSKTVFDKLLCAFAAVAISILSVLIARQQEPVVSAMLISLFS